MVKDAIFGAMRIQEQLRVPSHVLFSHLGLMKLPKKVK